MSKIKGFRRFSIFAEKEKNRKINRFSLANSPSANGNYVRLIKPFPYKGKLHLYDVDASLVEVLSPIHTKEADREFEQYYKQLYIEAGAEF